eukprot:5291226-Pyramimonas_sp.AAC.1
MSLVTKGRSRGPQAYTGTVYVSRSIALPAFALPRAELGRDQAAGRSLDWIDIVRMEGNDHALQRRTMG